MRVHDGAEAETLWCLRAEKSIPRYGFPVTVALCLERIGNGQKRDRGVGPPFERRDHAFDQRARNKWPCRIVNEDSIGAMHRQRI